MSAPVVWREVKDSPRKMTEEMVPKINAVYGSSAGALNAAWLLCGRAESTMHAWWDRAIMETTINPRRVLRGRPVVDTRYLVHTVYTEIMPMGFQEILDSPVEFHPIATDALTGEAVDLHDQIRDQASLQATLRATAAMPLLAGEPVKINGRPFVDAGLSEEHRYGVRSPRRRPISLRFVLGVRTSPSRLRRAPNAC
jgi:predicted patatin/cPLA2 family phospholipase